MRSRLAILFAVFLLAAIACRADSVVSVELAGDSNCTRNCPSPGLLLESLNASLLWDVNAASVIPGTLSVSANGPITDNTFSFSGFEWFAANEPEFDFKNGIGDVFELTLFPNGTPSFPGSAFPAPDFYYGNTNVICGSPTDDCSFYGLNGLNLLRATGDVAPVPEETHIWELLLISLVAIVFTRRWRSLDRTT